MAIERSKRRMAPGRLAAIARNLLEASPLCAIATVAPGGQAYLNTAYFAWSPGFELVWLSEPHAKHSCNIRANNSVAVAVYDSGQNWGGRDRGIQLSGTARELDRATADDAERLYAARFPDYRAEELAAYRFYVLRSRRLKVFDEGELGVGVFVTARTMRDRRLVWEPAGGGCVFPY
jgi:uncharacterized protein YhbP (UPF0306 family)